MALTFTWRPVVRRAADGPASLEQGLRAARTWSWPRVPKKLSWDLAREAGAGWCLRQGEAWPPQLAPSHPIYCPEHSEEPVSSSSEDMGLCSQLKIKIQNPKSSLLCS